MSYNKKTLWEFYTATKEGQETLIATKTLKHPKTSKVYIDMQNKGFADNIHLYGYRLAENNQ